jgi:amino acid adenylation domain-containing protein
MLMPAALTHSQQQIWVGQRLAPDSPLYNMAFAFIFPAGLRTDVFREAWQRVVAASDALRTRIIDNGTGEPQRTVTAHGAVTGLADPIESSHPDAAFLDWCRARCARPLSPGGDLLDSVLVPFQDGRTGWYLNQHHLITDAHSTVLLFRAVAAEYESALGRCAPDRSPLPSYYDTLAALPAGASLREQAAAYWKARRGCGRAVSMYGRPAAPKGTASTRLTLELDEHRSRALEAHCREAGLASLSDHVSRLALFAALLVSWLHHISGESALGFDTPVGGRSTATARRSLGLFIELFPFQVSVDPSETFRTLAAKCLAEAADLLRHALPGTSAPSTASANSVVLNYVPVSFGAFAGLPVHVEWIHPGHGDSVHALRLQVHDFSASGRYTLHFDFNDAALDNRLRGRSLEHFENVVDAFLADPDSRIAACDIRTEDERRALARVNATGSAPLPRESVVAAFERTAAREPGRIALRQGDAELTFGELRAQTDAVASALVALGVQTGDRVAIAGRRSMPVIAAILGVLKARAAYLPIDAATPSGRIEYLLRDSGARVVLAGPGAEIGAVSGEVEVLQIEDVIQTARGVPQGLAAPALSDLAYLLYTSGSTGEPKGVLIEHGGLADYLAWAERTYVRGDRLTYALFTSLAFDLTVTSLFLPLITSGTLDIYPEPDGPVDSALVDVASANRCDFVKLTPSHLALLRRIGLEGSRIRRMVVGGEDLKASPAAAISAQLGGAVEIYNEYGPTEAVVGCVAHRFDPDRDQAGSVPIGVPADHVRVEIFNDAGAPVPEGVPGELWVSRFGLARGYHGHAELTAERFVDGPPQSQGRRYRTGDLVRFIDPSTLEYLGRIDRQVKISGHRVEPGEIEAALLAVPGVEQGIVSVRRRFAASTPSAPVHHCVRCGLPSNYPRVTFDGDGVCSICRAYAAIEPRARAYFRTMEDLAAVFRESRAAHPSARYDCLMLYSGGKDSTYALGRLVEMGLSVYAFTLDNGFISTDAKDNIRRVTAHLGVPVEFGTTPGMAAIFRDSLARFSNVCNGCFKTIYTLGMLRARDLGTPLVVTGLSRGQMFETRLSEDMFRDERRDLAEVDDAVLAARKAYHRTPDAVSKVIDVRPFEDDRIFEQVRVVDFYRYCDVPLDEMLSYLGRMVPWVRPADTGRSTNCLINDAGIYVHQKERGYHSYALPYSWDVRLGHKTREAALEELDDEIDPEHVRRMLAEIGYDESAAVTSEDQPALVGFYVSRSGVAEEDVRRQLAQRLPPYLVPMHLQRVDAIPLTPNGKVDEGALLRAIPDHDGARTADYVPPDGPVAEFLARVWQEELAVDRVGSGDSFFALGGTSLVALQMMVRLCREFDISLPLSTVFTHPRLGDLARVAEDRILADAEEMRD